MGTGTKILLAWSITSYDRTVHLQNYYTYEYIGVSSTFDNADKLSNIISVLSYIYPARVVMLGLLTNVIK